MHTKNTPSAGLCECGCGRSTQVARRDWPEKGHVKGQPLRFLLGHNMRATPYPDTEYVVDPETGCWIWQLGLDKDGYGRLERNGKKTPASRWYYEQRFGPLPEGMVPDHICPAGPNPSCVNPDHMRPLTHAENSRWKSSTKLDWEAVAEIRLMALQGYTQREIGERFGIVQAQVHRIVTGKRWAPRPR